MSDWLHLNRTDILYCLLCGLYAPATPRTTLADFLCSHCTFTPSAAAWQTPEAVARRRLQQQRAATAGRSAELELGKMLTEEWRMYEEWKWSDIALRVQETGEAPEELLRRMEEEERVLGLVEAREGMLAEGGLLESMGRLGVEDELSDGTELEEPGMMEGVEGELEGLMGGLRVGDGTVGWNLDHFPPAISS